MLAGKSRLYPAYSLSGSEGEDNSLNLRNRTGYSQNNHHPSAQSQPQHNHYQQHKQRSCQQQQQQHPLYHVAGSGAGLSDTPTSGNASDETLTDSDLTNPARDITQLVHNGEFTQYTYTLLCHHPYTITMKNCIILRKTVKNFKRNIVLLEKKGEKMKENFCD